MRTIKELYTLGGKIYLWFESDNAYDHFKRKAAEEGFTLPDGSDDILALGEDMSFSHPGYIGHMWFYQCYESSCTVKLIRIDYTNWITGAVDYHYHGARMRDT